MTASLVRPIIAICLTLLATDICWAQNSMFGSSGISNRSPTSSSLGMGNSAFGSRGMGWMGGMGGMGSSGLGGLGSMGMGGMGNNRGGTGFGNTGTGFGNTQGQGQGGFIGRNANANQFIGMNTLTGGNQGQFNNRQGGGGNFGNRGGFNLNNLTGLQNFNSSTSNSNQNQTPTIRARQKVGFEYAKPETAAFEAAMQTRFVKLTERNKALKDVTLSVDEAGVIVLQGDVASESAARLAEKIVRLEPGVRTVRSELTFPSSTDDQ